MSFVDLLAEMCENYLIQTLESEERINECNNDATTTEPTNI
ncbi:hypothetical protein [Lysinibacillus capsici]